MSRTLLRLVLLLVLAGLALLGRSERDPTSDPRPSDPESIARSSERFPAICEKVHDGDTLTVRADGETLRIRVFGIDAPEKGQPWADRARSELRRKVRGEPVVVLPVEEDSWGRLVARIEVDGEDLGEWLLSRGLVWHFRRYSDDDRYETLEATARTQGRGLWSDRDPTPPWTWRAQRR